MRVHTQRREQALGPLESGRRCLPNRLNLGHSCQAEVLIVGEQITLIGSGDVMIPR